MTPPPRPSSGTYSSWDRNMRMEVDRLKRDLYESFRPPAKATKTPAELAAIRAVDGFSAALTYIADTHRGAARMLGVSEGTIRDWLHLASGTRQLPARAISLLAQTSVHSFMVWVRWQLRALPWSEQKAFATSLLGLIEDEAVRAKFSARGA